MVQKQVTASNMDGASGSAVYVGVPDECPICHRGTNPRDPGGVVIGEFNQSEGQLRVVFQCTWRDCAETFFGYYTRRNGESGTAYYFDKVAPVSAKKGTIPESVSKVSPSFVEIHNQALAAEAAALNEITRIGLRKALEFLVKDFLINQEPAKTEEIKGKLLGKCIEEYITDPNIKATAKLATWLGNDETHYVRKWEDKDINDLEVLIRLTVNWIDSALLTQQYVKALNP